jgi:glycosyltransferase involved in cell wall biosynthesis
MRVLLLTPFAPGLAHRHAAADTIARLVPRLADKTELFVYSPQNAEMRDGCGYAVLPATTASPAGRLDRLGARPWWLRQAWSRAATREAAAHVDRLRPDVVHAEYLQSAEAILPHRNTVLGLHDITAEVMAESYRAASGPEKAYRLAELGRTRRFERTAMRRAGVVLTLSDADRAVAARYNARTVLARPGVELGDECWSAPTGTQRPRLVFTGAMWRRANVLAARLLAREVMPRVWPVLPDAELCLVGADPTPEVRALADAEPRITVTGTVPDLRQEMLAAHAVVAPSVVGGGVLMKVLHAMALGAPVVTTPGPAASVAGHAGNLFVASGPDEFAAAVVTAVREPAEAARRGRAARAHVADSFSWDGAVRAYLDAYTMVGQR